MAAIGETIGALGPPVGSVPGKGFITIIESAAANGSAKAGTWAIKQIKAEIKTETIDLKRIILLVLNNNEDRVNKRNAQLFEYKKRDKE